MSRGFLKKRFFVIQLSLFTSLLSILIFLILDTQTRNGFGA